MTLKDIMTTQIRDKADFLRDRPEYRNAMPGTMSKTMHAETMMKAWSPDWYHWFKFSVPILRVVLVSVCSHAHCFSFLSW